MFARAFRQAAILFCLALPPALVSGAIQLRWQHPRSAPASENAGAPASGALEWKREDPLAPDEVRTATARSWGKDVIYVDARSKERFDAGHIDGAVLLNHESWEALVPKFLDAWDPDKKVVVYCDGEGCDAARSVAERMRRDLQVPNIYVLKGGWPEWQSH
jgi:rhodanese-related sulfurtransferase